MSTRIRIVKRAGRWFTLGKEQATSHPTFALALAHAQHLNTPLEPVMIPTEHIAVRVSDLIADGWTVNGIAMATGVPATVVSDLATLPVGKLRNHHLDPDHAARIVNLYRIEAAA